MFVPLSPQMAQKHLKEAAALVCPGLSRFQPKLIVPVDWLPGEEVNASNPSQHSDDWWTLDVGRTRATTHLCRAPLAAFIWADQGEAGSQGPYAQNGGL